MLLPSRDSSRVLLGLRERREELRALPAPSVVPSAGQASTREQEGLNREGKSGALSRGPPGRGERPQRQAVRTAAAHRDASRGVREKDIGRWVISEAVVG